MKTLFDQIRHLRDAAHQRYPLLCRGVELLMVLALYSAGVLLVERLSSASFPVVLVALYFLPVLLRAWLQFYWKLRDELAGLRHRQARRHQH